MRILYAALFLVLLSCSSTVSYQIRDECGPIQGQVMHSIKDDDVCRIRCRGQCEALEHEFLSSSFVDKGLGCHDCNCSCTVS